MVFCCFFFLCVEDVGVVGDIVWVECEGIGCRGCCGV